MGEERRRWRRLTHGLRIQLEVLEPSHGAPVSCIGTHLSPEGLFVALSDPPKPNTRVRVSFGKEEEGSLQLQAEGTVVNRFVPDDTDERTGVGIRFEDAGAPWKTLYSWLAGAPADSEGD